MSSEMREIQLNRGLVALVDDDDFERVAALRWYAVTPSGRRWYALAHRGRKAIQRDVYLHRFVMNAAKGQIVDHIDRDGLNCRKENLRFATRSQNAANSPGRPAGRVSPYKGVVFHKQIGRWWARIKTDGEVISLGCFSTAEEAARAYDNAALKYFGEFAGVNTYPLPTEKERVM